MKRWRAGLLLRGYRGRRGHACHDCPDNAFFFLQTHRAHYVTGPKDVIDPGQTGYMLPTGLSDSIKAALLLDRQSVVQVAREKWTLEVMGRIFMENLARVQDRRKVFVRRAPFRNSGLRYVLAGIALAVYRSVLGDGKGARGVLATLGSFLITIYFLIIVPFTAIDDA